MDIWAFAVSQLHFAAMIEVLAADLARKMIRGTGSVEVSCFDSANSHFWTRNEFEFSSIQFLRRLLFCAVFTATPFLILLLPWVWLQAIALSALTLFGLLMPFMETSLKFYREATELDSFNKVQVEGKEYCQVLKPVLLEQYFPPLRSAVAWCVGMLAYALAGWSGADSAHAVLVVAATDAAIALGLVAFHCWALSRSRYDRTCDRCFGRIRNEATFAGRREHYSGSHYTETQELVSKYTCRRCGRVVVE